MLSLRHLLPSGSPGLFESTISKILTFGGNSVITREASKKTSSNTKCSSKPRPKHRGVRVYAGAFVHRGTLLALQNINKKLRFHPGFNVGMGRNGTIYALEDGTVYISTEIADLNWDNKWVLKHYSGREDQVIYKKYFNILTNPQHNRFKLIDQV